MKAHAGVRIENRNGEVVTGNVTDGHCPPVTTIEGRNAERWREDRKRVEGANKRGENCGACGRRLEPGEPVCRREVCLVSAPFMPRYWLTLVCKQCTPDRGHFMKPYPCEGCSRPVANMVNGRNWYRRHIFCSSRCESRYRWQVIKQKRREGGFICKACGNAFEPPRSDATHCSNACRQRDHRKRKRKDCDIETRTSTEVMDVCGLSHADKEIKYLQLSEGN